MPCVYCCLLFVAWLVVVCSLLAVVRCVLLAVCCFLRSGVCVVSCVLFASCCFGCRWRRAVSRVWFAACCSLSIVCCIGVAYVVNDLLFVGCCLLCLESLCLCCVASVLRVVRC